MDSKKFVTVEFLAKINLTVKIRTSSGGPKGTNFTCNIFTIFPARIVTVKIRKY